jgi:hypothetical protein
MVAGRLVGMFDPLDYAIRQDAAGGRRAENQRCRMSTGLNMRRTIPRPSAGVDRILPAIVAMRIFQQFQCRNAS